MKIHLGKRTFEIKGRDYLLATIDRKELGQWMAREAEKAGAKILTNSKVEVVEKNRVILKNDQIIYFDYLIGADGGLSIVRKSLHLPIKFALTFQYTLPQYFENLEIFYDPELFGAGYAWIFPYRNRVKIGCGSDLKFQKPTQLLGNFHQWLKKMKINYEGAKLESLIINYHYRGYQFGNIFLIGEAGGFVSGLSGAGIYTGLISGQEIAKKIINQKYKPKIGLMLTSQKFQEKILWLLNLNRFLMKYLIEILILVLVFNNKFSNFLKKFSKDEK
jgi:geranylgeranyl reductase